MLSGSVFIVAGNFRIVDLGKFFSRHLERQSRLAFLSLLLLGTLFFAQTHSAECAADKTNHASSQGETAGVLLVPGGTLRMDWDSSRPEKLCARSARVNGLWIDKHEVTNARSGEFVELTGYVTVAEEGIDPPLYPGMPPSLAAPNSVAFIQPTNLQKGGSTRKEWQNRRGVDRHHPEGPDRSIDDMDQHSVVHIAYGDARSYAQWRGRFLPAEARWEFPALGDLGPDTDWIKPYDEYGRPSANIWQGYFLLLNAPDDGFQGTVPVDCFKSNEYGLQDRLGNVREWTSNWCVPGRPSDVGRRVDPTGPDRRLMNALAPAQIPRRVIKGGSCLGAMNCCGRYRPTARQPKEANLGAASLGSAQFSTSHHREKATLIVATDVAVKTVGLGKKR